jgi:hypothetical protein
MAMAFRHVPGVSSYNGMLRRICICSRHSGMLCWMLSLVACVQPWV